MATDYTSLLRSGTTEEFAETFGDLSGHVSTVRSMARKMSDGEALTAKEQAVALYLANLADPGAVDNKVLDVLEKENAIGEKLYGTYRYGVHTAFIDSPAYQNWVQAGQPGKVDIGMPTSLAGQPGVGGQKPSVFHDPRVAPTYWDIRGNTVTSGETPPQVGVTRNEDGTATFTDASGTQTQGYVDAFGNFVPIPPDPQDDDPRYLGGFPAGYGGPRTVPESVADLQRLYRGETEFGRVEPQYLENQNWAQFAGKDPVYLNQIQLTMWEAGVLDKDDMTPGWWGPNEAKAMGQLMIEANAATANSGREVSWIDVARARIDAGVRKQMDRRAGPKLAPFVQAPYMEPDYANLSQAVRQAFSAQLGRQPEDWELALLADQLNTDYRAQYEAETAANRAYHNAGNRAIVSEQAQASGEFEDVDPLARLREAVQTRYAPEIEAEEQIAEGAFNVQSMMRNLAGIESVVGGV